MDDVLIIGAGAAGLSAAEKLGAAGARVRILDARDRIGGRVFTTRPSAAPLPVELGAEFVHGKPPETWRLIEPSGAALVEVPMDHLYAPRTRLQADRDLFDDVESGFDRLRRERNRDQSLAEFLNANPKDKTLRPVQPVLTSYVENFHAADIARISLAALLQSERAADEVEGDRAFRFVNGYDTIFKALNRLRTIDVTLSTPVTLIEWRGGRVIVTARPAGKPAQKFTARQALITLPLGVLKARPDEAGYVAFDPPLEQKRAALQRLNMGNVVRIALKFDSRFWEQIGRKQSGVSEKTLRELSFLTGHALPVPVWWTARPLLVPMLTGWMGGPAALRLARRGKDAVFAAALESLALVFGLKRADLARKVGCWFYHDWTADPHSRGAYSYVAVGGMNAQRELASALKETLFFAGEATEASGHCATVHGAIRSGLRAAEEILAQNG